MTGSLSYGSNFSLTSTTTTNSTYYNTSNSGTYYTNAGNYSFDVVNSDPLIEDCEGKDIEVGDRVIYSKYGRIVEGIIVRFTAKVVIMEDGYWISLKTLNKIYKL